MRQTKWSEMGLDNIVLMLSKPCRNRAEVYPQWIQWVQRDSGRINVAIHGMIWRRLGVVAPSAKAPAYAMSGVADIALMGLRSDSEQACIHEVRPKLE